MRNKAITSFNEGEVWLAYLGTNIGYEENGSGPKLVRPVVIVKRYGKNLFFGIPLSTKNKLFPFYFPLGKIAGKDSSAMLIQARSFSSKRLMFKMDTLSPTLFRKLKSAAMVYTFGS